MRWCVRVRFPLLLLVDRPVVQCPASYRKLLWKEVSATQAALDVPPPLPVEGVCASARFSKFVSCVIVSY